MLSRGQNPEGVSIEKKQKLGFFFEGDRFDVLVLLDDFTIIRRSKIFMGILKWNLFIKKEHQPKSRAILEGVI